MIFVSETAQQSQYVFLIVDIGIVEFGQHINLSLAGLVGNIRTPENLVIISVP